MLFKEINSGQLWNVHECWWNVEHFGRYAEKYYKDLEVNSKRVCNVIIRIEDLFAK